MAKEKAIESRFTFFVHMIDQLSKHGGFDIDLGKGDLEVDAHHTVEDVGISLGEAFNNALVIKGILDLALHTSLWMRLYHRVVVIFPDDLV